MVFKPKKQNSIEETRYGGVSALASHEVSNRIQQGTQVMVDSAR